MAGTTLLTLSTCGTSILTNGAAPELRRLLTLHANAASFDTIDPAERRPIQQVIDASRSRLEGASQLVVRGLSAEVNGLLALGIAPSPTDLHYVLATDTALGRAAADLIIGWLSAQGFVAQRLDIQDLRTHSLEEFRGAVSELVDWCERSLKGYRDAGTRIVFNLTGGFKGVNGFVQALGMIYADETVYLFESGQELIRIPRLPLQLDSDDVIARRLSTFRRLADGRQLPFSDLADVPDTLLSVVDDQAGLSVWGETQWAGFKSRRYGERVLAPWSTRVIFDDGFLGSCTSLERDRIFLINERVDDLCDYAESNMQRPRRRLDFKALKGAPLPPYTHECDAWSDGAAKRIFCRVDNGSIHVGRLGAHL